MFVEHPVRAAPPEMGGIENQDLPNIPFLKQKCPRIIIRGHLTYFRGELATRDPYLVQVWMIKITTVVPVYRNAVA